MSKKDVQQLCSVVAALRKNGFASLAEAEVFCAAASATIADELIGVSEIRRTTGQPISTVSRAIWDLSKRGLLEYTSHSTDRRLKLIRAKLESFKF